MKPLNLYLAIVSLLIDATAVLGGLWLAYVLRTHGGELFNWPFMTYLHRIVLVTPIWLVLFASQGLYNPRALPRGWNGLGRLLIGLVAAWGIVLIILYFWRSPEATTLSRLLVVYAIALTAIFLTLGRLIVGLIVGILYRTGTGSVRTVVIDGSQENPFATKLTREWGHGHRVIGVFAADEALEKMAALIKTERIEEVIVDHPNLNEEMLLKFLSWAELHGANFAAVPSLLSVRATNIETSTLAGTPVTYFLRTPLEGWRRVYKRLLDLVLVIPALIILSPIFLVLALLVKLTSKGPVIYREPRVGQDGKVFSVGKFRSMYGDWRERFPNVQDWSTDEKTDIRITPIGRFTRKTNLDELPQLWDVFMGRMSLVGPRPEQPKYVEKFSHEVPDYLRRHNVKSGLTGWAQVNGLRGDTSIPERVKYDLYYIEHWTIWFDVRIIIATFVLVARSLFGGR